MKMKGVAKKPLLFFLHIPKTAGSSIHQILHQEYLDRLGLVTDPDTRKIQLQLENPDQPLDCVFGHYPFGLHASTIRAFEYSTLVREPVEAILSYYYYIAQQPGHWLHMSLHSMTMERFFEQPEEILGLFFRNYQTAQLTGKPSASFAEAASLINRHYPIVGITELYCESIYLMKKRYGWGPVRRYYVNVTSGKPKREQHSPEILRRIESLVDQDAQMYRFTKDRLLRMIQALPEYELRLIEEFKRTGYLV
jgi:hypothetical protein